MEAVTIHKLNDNLVVSLTELPGFRKLGAVVVKDEQGLKSGSVTVYFAGDYFDTQLEPGEFDTTRNQITKLVRNYAIKKEYGVSTGRFNLALTLRERNNAQLAEVA
ncbi:hypothetical protein D3C87_957930 [compost metagenome]|jgi:hypothetical protein